MGRKKPKKSKKIGVPKKVRPFGLSTGGC